MTDISAFPGHLIRRFQQIAVAIFGARMAEAGLDLTPVQFAALAMLEEHPGVDQATLSGLVAYDRVTMGGVVDRLAGKGLLERSVSSTDRRSRLLRLTPRGRTALAQAGPVVASIQVEILKGLTAEQGATLVRLLQTAIDTGNESSRAPLRAIEPLPESDESVAGPVQRGTGSRRR